MYVAVGILSNRLTDLIAVHKVPNLDAEPAAYIGRGIAIVVTSDVVKTNHENAGEAGAISRLHAAVLGYGDSELEAMSRIDEVFKDGRIIVVGNVVSDATIDTAPRYRIVRFDTGVRLLFSKGYVMSKELLGRIALVRTPYRDIVIWIDRVGIELLETVIPSVYSPNGFLRISEEGKRYFYAALTSGLPEIGSLESVCERLGIDADQMNRFIELHERASSAVETYQRTGKGMERAARLMTEAIRAARSIPIIGSALVKTLFPSALKRVLNGKIVFLAPSTKESMMEVSIDGEVRIIVSRSDAERLGLRIEDYEDAELVRCRVSIDELRDIEEALHR